MSMNVAGAQANMMEYGANRQSREVSRSNLRPNVSQAASPTPRPDHGEDDPERKGIFRQQHKEPPKLRFAIG